MIYICTKCTKSFDRKSNYVCHLNRKKPCSIGSTEVENVFKKLEKRIENLELENSKMKQLLNLAEYKPLLQL